MLDNQMDGGLGSFGLSVQEAEGIRKMALGRVVPFQQLDVSLSAALSLNQTYPIAGDFALFTFDESLIASIYPNAEGNSQVIRAVLLGPDGQPGARLHIGPGTTIEAPFYGMAFETPSAVFGAMRITYGTGVRMTSYPRQIAVGRSANARFPVQFTGTALFANEYRSSNALAANTPENILLAAQNVAGIWVQYATLAGNAATAGIQCVTYGSAAPTTATDGNSMLMRGVNTTFDAVQLAHPKTPSPALRLDRISSVAETAAYFHMAYRLAPA